MRLRSSPPTARSRRTRSSPHQHERGRRRQDPRRHLRGSRVLRRRRRPPHNDVAESIETDDAQHYTIKIRDGLKFTNGEPVTANSFVDAWNYGANTANGPQLSQYFFESIKGFSYEDEVAELPGLVVVDDTTFTVELNQPESDFPLRLGYSAFYPLPPASAFDDLDAFGENPVGNGPYKLAGEGAWKHNEKIDLVVNDDYDGPRTPENDGLSIIFYATQDAAYADLQGGNLDVLDAIPRLGARDLRGRVRRPFGQPGRGDLPVVHDPGPSPALLG